MMMSRSSLLREGRPGSDWPITLHMEFWRDYWDALPHLSSVSPGSPYKYREMAVKLVGEIHGVRSRSATAVDQKIFWTLDSPLYSPL